jgi:hypothetical protein
MFDLTESFRSTIIDLQTPHTDLKEARMRRMMPGLHQLLLSRRPFRRQFSALLLLCLLLLNCQGDEPEGLTQEEENLLVETTVRLSIAAQQHAGEADVLSAQQDSIFSSLGLEREDYHCLVEKMGQRPEGWLEVWERIAERIEEASGDKRDAAAG